MQVAPADKVFSETIKVNKVPHFRKIQIYELDLYSDEMHGQKPLGEAYLENWVHYTTE